MARDGVRRLQRRRGDRARAAPWREGRHEGPWQQQEEAHLTLNRLALIAALGMIVTAMTVYALTPAPVARPAEPVVVEADTARATMPASASSRSVRPVHSEPPTV